MIKEIDIADWLKKYLNRPFVYVPNPGNAGDKLIAYATYQIFDELALDYTVGGFSSIYEGCLLVYGGGGNFVDGYNQCSDFVKNNAPNNEIVILPHTINGNYELLSDLGDNVVLFCRERRSYDYVYNSLKHKENVYLSSDLALCVNVPKSLVGRIGSGVCNAFRIDRERTNFPMPCDNVDLSSVLDSPGLGRVNVEKVSLRLFTYLSNFSVVNTNRLHVAIAAFMLGKKVNFYPGNYYKNKAVYQQSLAEKELITFHDDHEIMIAEQGNPVVVTDQEIASLLSAVELIGEKDANLCRDLIFLVARSTRNKVLFDEISNLL